MNAETVLQFWFVQTPPALWFAKSEAFDGQIRDRFAATHQAAASGELFTWRDTLEGRLAEIIVLDQLSRNLFRDTAQAFAHDGMALALAQEAVRSGVGALPPERRAFAYMPYMHSESPLIHARALELFSQPGLERSLDFEKAHAAIIERFGRYPHRNAALGRASTEAERAFFWSPARRSEPALSPR